mgnify:CR=1 FL=1
MRSKNPEVMNAICTFVDQYYREHHASPSVNEIAQASACQRRLPIATLSP